MDGLSQQDRIERVNNTQRFDVIDNDMKSLLSQVKSIAGFIRYYNLKGKENGYFDKFLNEWQQILDEYIADDNNEYIPDGNMEPAQALLFTFLRQFREMTETFNRRWDNYIYWYLQDYLGVRYLEPGTHKVCLLFTKNTPEPCYLTKGTEVIPKGDDPELPAYRLCEDTIVENISIEKVFSLSQTKNGEWRVENESPPHAQRSTFNSHSGFIITSPSLLLREGRRQVTMTFTAENSTGEYHDSRMFEHPFYICISTEEGWKHIPDDCCSFGKKGNDYILVFVLPEGFPATVPCTDEVHTLRTETPAVRVYLNYDAWLCPYSWLVGLRFSRLQITCRVEGIRNILVYNDLGKADCSKPFTPFGINTEKGSWFTIGNYEMAQKNTQGIDLVVDWDNLPAGTTGMKEYYKGYKPPVDNTSFKIKTTCLRDNQWMDGTEYPLFGMTANAPLKKRTVIRGIDVAKMSQVIIPEETYDYTIDSREGFVKITLQSPEMGFGEKTYRNLYSEYFLKKALSKKKLFGYIQPNEPYKPVIERLRMNYISEETIDFRKTADTASSTFFQISPFGYRQVYPASKQHLVKALFSMDTDAGILISLRNACRGSMLTLYFDFRPLRKELTADDIPQIKWSVGNGYRWKLIPDGNLIEDKTMNLIQNGIVRLILPNDLNTSLFDAEGLIWLRAGIEKNRHAIPNLNNVYSNVAEAESCRTGLYDKRSLSDAEWRTREPVPGIETIRTVESYHGRKQENRERCLMRVSEYTTHRGKAVTPRDYERITLQAFPYVAKVKCLPALPAESGKKGIVTLVIIPKIRHTFGKKEQDRPLATSRLIFRIEAFLKHRISAYVGGVNVINPLYEEVQARCLVTFRGTFPSAWCKASLARLLDEWIAPWQAKQTLPVFDYLIHLSSVKEEMMKQKYVKEVAHLSFVVITETADGTCRLHEYGTDDNSVRPSAPYAILVPAKEHHISTDKIDDRFGISEMTIDESFIIPD